MNKTKSFIPAKPAGWLIKTAQTVVRAELALKNKLHLEESDLSVLQNLPQGAGVVLASNHADETDPRVCLELSRRSNKRFISMCNREAFDEVFGMAGWALQRLGMFSVQRGAHDRPAKSFAIDVMRQGQDILVIFPEGEIFYLNEQLQPFHSGAIEIGMQAVIDKRKTDPNWTAFIVPMAIKYRHNQPIEGVLEKRIAKMEEHLSITLSGSSLKERLRTIQRILIDREATKHNIELSSNSQDLTIDIVKARREILAKVEEKHSDMPVARRRTIDDSWQLGAELRDSLDKTIDPEKRKDLISDIETLKEVAQLTSWKPSYYGSEDASLDRLAEAVIKMERELYGVKRPPQMANRDVFVSFDQPIDLGTLVADYETDAHAVRRNVTDQLQSRIQALVDKLATEKRT